MKQETKPAELYWKANIRLILYCLSIWFFVSFICGIVLVEPLNQFQVGGYKLGFWFAQQGSILSFILLIFYYAYKINKIERQFGVDEE